MHTAIQAKLYKLNIFSLVPNSSEIMHKLDGFPFSPGKQPGQLLKLSVDHVGNRCLNMNRHLLIMF